jgi:hypothetical protein
MTTILSLLVLEGIIKRLNPKLDFQAEAVRLVIAFSIRDYRHKSET